MSFGIIQVLLPDKHAEVPLSGVGGGFQWNSIKVLNPNDGIAYIARNRDCLGQSYGAWDWKIPSQSYAKLPGPNFQTVGIFYVDQSGAGHNGEITVFPSVSRFDDPEFNAIGRALPQGAVSLDVTEGFQPTAPSSGILRIWADGADILHILSAGGIDKVLHPDAGVSIGTTTVNLGPVASNKNVWFYTKALGGSKTINAPAANQMYPPGLTTQASSYTSVNGESIDWYCDGIFWYGI